MSITHLNSLSQLNGILAKSKDKLSVIDFHATWCGPCHAIAPVFETLSKRFTNVNFLKCDVDAARDVASNYGVRAMPTFIFLKGSTKVDEVRGADRAGLERALNSHSSGTLTNTFVGKGQALGGPSKSSAPPFKPQADGVLAWWNGFNPQFRLLTYLVLGYLFFGYFL